MPIILQSSLRIGLPQVCIAGLAIATVEARRQSQRHSEEIYSRTKEAVRENISGKHIGLIRQGSCLGQSLALQPALAITRFDIRRNRSRESFRRKSNLIRDRQILYFYQSKKIFGIGKLSYSLTLSFFDFGLFRETNSASASLYISQDTTHSRTCTHCNQKLMHSVPRRGLQYYDA